MVKTAKTGVNLWKGLKQWEVTNGTVTQSHAKEDHAPYTLKNSHGIHTNVSLPGEGKFIHLCILHEIDISDNLIHFPSSWNNGLCCCPYRTGKFQILEGVINIWQRPPTTQYHWFTCLEAETMTMGRMNQKSRLMRNRIELVHILHSKTLIAWLLTKHHLKLLC